MRAEVCVEAAEAGKKKDRSSAVKVQADSPRVCQSLEVQPLTAPTGGEVDELGGGSPNRSLSSSSAERMGATDRTRPRELLAASRIDD